MTDEKITCPVCSREWKVGCEQAVAVRKRGKCIACLVEANERWCMEPYEFEAEDDH